ncbi:hypothetical protein LJ756_03360 [Arthrobacter sp. zg-Y411]|uniref:hypothetical protein n=1 Tax=Arthrobacter zhangbolii TaxID=2886936 RepID=UPI001D150506|nr:hypothetical protein [Arthrobacter zhangbolii]MCC3293653.1 hypothetical protein [Arthrobacter zhangbolii]
MLLAAVWWCFLVRITVEVDGQEIILRGPLWKRSVQQGSVHNVAVAKDTGLNTGLVNWPVTRHERGSLTRLNMGGAGGVTFSDAHGHRYQVVLADLPSAEQMAQAIES